MEKILSTMLSLDPFSIFLGAILGTLVNLWANFLLKQPKLHNCGGGSGNYEDGTVRNHITLENKVGWFGINLHESRLLGLRIHPPFRYGLSFEKSIARDCRATLHLKENNEFVGALWWRLKDGTYSDVIDIKSGNQASLMLFAKMRNNNDRYFLYKPVSRDDGTVDIPEESSQLVGPKDFVLKINYSHSHLFSMELRIEQKFNGLLYLVHGTGSGLF